MEYAELMKEKKAKFREYRAACSEARERPAGYCVQHQQAAFQDTGWPNRTVLNRLEKRVILVHQNTGDRKTLYPQSGFVK